MSKPQIPDYRLVFSNLLKNEEHPLTQLEPINDDIVRNLDRMSVEFYRDRCC